MGKRTTDKRRPLLPAMERAVAFITDEGGITCHAAIVAREMKKPCIIGTKTATKILKNGDFVEVDAINGIVKIIKQNDEKMLKLDYDSLIWYTINT